MESVRRIRREKGLSQQELANLAGVGQDSISAIETGKHEPHPRTLRKLAEALDVEVADFFREPAVPLAEAPREAGQLQTSAQTIEEFELALARVLEPVRREALQEQQAANRFRASEGVRQDRVVDLAEAEAGKRFEEEFSADERPLAFGEVALGYARLERDNANLQELLQEHGEKIAQLEKENAHLREERKREAAR